MAIAGYRTGITISANLSTGGFDTHSDHVNRQTQALDRLSSGIDEIWDEVVLHGLEDRVVILVTSDFGRTPGFNDGNGKDHWPVTSMMVMRMLVTTLVTCGMLVSSRVTSLWRNHCERMNESTVVSQMTFVR